MSFAKPTDLSGQIPLRLGRPETAAKKTISWSNLAVGAGMNVFQVSSLGQPMEVVKTYVCNPPISECNGLLMLLNRSLQIETPRWRMQYVLRGREEDGKHSIKA